MVLPEDPEDADPGLAAERTRLAWVRTAIAFAAVGCVVLRNEPAIGLVVLAMTPLIWALGRVAGRPVRPGKLSRRLLLVTVTVTAVALAAAVVAFIGHGPASLKDLLRG